MKNEKCISHFSLLILILCRRPSIGSAEHVFESHLLGFLFVQLPAPPHPFRGVGTVASVFKLQITSRLLALFLPVVPSLGTNQLWKRAMHEERIAIVTPRTAKVDFLHILSGSDGAVVEHIAIVHRLRCRGCCDVAVGLAMDVAPFEPCRRRTEDAVCCALNLAIAEEHSRIFHACVYGVLMA